ncbi:MAG: 4-hydroxythreonine-4-phosphate dehydrogenase PdxA [Cyclobacteriaceae bacterium]|nr:4-hydroxythreonine-4-phosphate dehydrogenase PdxA [Cyclobacteriaceae bacterium]
MGDPASIGPEIIVKTLNDTEIYQKCRPLVCGDAFCLQAAIDVLNSPLKINRVTEPDQAEFSHGIIDVFDLENVNQEYLQMGRVSAMAGNASFEYVAKVIELALARKIDATVTAPINKESINLAGHHYAGHTEIYADLTQTKRYAMLLVEKNLRVIHATTHVSLRQACDLIKKERVLEVIQLLNEACIGFGIENPRIGVAGLNPHAGDGGLFGDEDELEIKPAIQMAVEQGILAEGPVPPDTLFAKAVQEYYDGCVAMYHDQGHIPFKMIGFKWNNETKTMDSVKGVNITLGLPIIRVSVDHGTAFEIAGKGVASEDAMSLAIDYATKMAQNRIRK